MKNKLLLTILLFNVSICLGASRKVQDPIANDNFNIIDQQLLNTVKKSGTQTIHGNKMFADNTVCQSSFTTNALISNTTINNVGIGKVLQVVSFSTNTQTTTTNTTFTNTALTLSITPTKATSRIAIFVSGDIQIVAVVGVSAYLTIARGTTNLGNAQGMTTLISDTDRISRNPVSMVYVDSPNTTNSTTYYIQLATTNTDYAVSFPSGNLPLCTIILVEIAE